MAARVPAEAIGAGAGMASEYANTDLMGAYAGLGEDLSLGLEGLRIGDLVALADAGPPLRPRLPPGLPDDRRHLHRPVHAVRPRAGPEHAAERARRAPSALVDDPDANLARWLHRRRGRRTRR